MRRHVFGSKLLSCLFLITLGALFSRKIHDLGLKSPIHTPATQHTTNVKPVDKNCTACNPLINTVLKDYSLDWTKNEGNYQKLRNLLITNCNGFQKIVLTQINTPLGTTIVYDGQKRSRRVNEDLFNNFPKDSPFSDKILNTCAVVGNGAILANSSCGGSIDSAQFVIRCNLPPLEKWSKDVGTKTGLVTANPTIFTTKYGSMQGRRRAFVDKISIYRDSLLFISAFSFAFGTDVSLKVRYTLQDFRSPMETFFINPDYLRNLYSFWRSQGLNSYLRLTSGLIMVSLAVEICNNVNVYGFWPFDNHPYGFQPLTEHYYDNTKPSRFHAMSAEFAYLVKLHNQGVLRLQLGECPPQ